MRATRSVDVVEREREDGEDSKSHLTLELSFCTTVYMDQSE